MSYYLTWKSVRVSILSMVPTIDVSLSVEFSCEESVIIYERVVWHCSSSEVSMIIYFMNLSINLKLVVQYIHDSRGGIRGIDKMKLFPTRPFTFS